MRRAVSRSIATLTLLTAVIVVTGCSGSSSPQASAVSSSTAPKTFTMHGTLTVPPGTNASNPCLNQGPNFSIGSPVMTWVSGGPETAGRVTATIPTSDRRSCDVSFSIPGVPVTAGPYSLRFNNWYCSTVVPASMVRWNLRITEAGALYAVGG